MAERCTREQYDRVMQLHREGSTQVQIQQLTGISRPTIRRR